MSNTLISRGKTLVIQPLPGIGDGIWHMRALQAIARTTDDGQITLLTRKKSQSDQFLKHEPWIKDVLWLDETKHFGKIGALSLGRDLKKHGFDTVWILHHSARYYIAASFAGIKTRLGYGFGWLKDMLTTPQHLSRQDKALHPIERFEKFFGLLQLLLRVEDRLVTTSPALKESITQEFKDMPRPWIAFGFGATEISRIWP